MAALPTSHDELRARLEAAGVAPDQIAAVMNSPNSQQQLFNQPQIPEQPPPAYSPRQNNDGVPAPAASPDLSRYRPAPVDLSKYRPFDKEKKIRYKVHFVSGGDGKKITQKVVLEGKLKAEAEWTVEFIKSPGLSKEPNMRMFREDGNGDRHQICECKMHHRMNKKVEIKYPWTTWEPWNPNLQSWGSNVDFLDGAWMIWNYFFEYPKHQDKPVLQCMTLEGVDGGRAGVFGEARKGPAETCRIAVALDETSSTIELPEHLWKDATKEQLDEMVSNAMIQFWRRVCGWWERDSRNDDHKGGWGGGRSGASVAAVTDSVSAPFG